MPLFEKIVNVLPHLCFSNFESALFQSAFKLAFLASLRVSEVVALGIKHITVSSDVITIFIKAFRTDQNGSGAIDTIVLFQSMQNFSALSSNISRESYFARLNSKQTLNPIPVFIHTKESFTVLEYSIIQLQNPLFLYWESDQFIYILYERVVRGTYQVDVKVAAVRSLQILHATICSMSCNPDAVNRHNLHDQILMLNI